MIGKVQEAQCFRHCSTGLRGDQKRLWYQYGALYDAQRVVAALGGARRALVWHFSPQVCVLYLALFSTKEGAEMPTGSGRHSSSVGVSPMAWPASYSVAR